MINRRTFPIEVTSPYAVKRMAEFLEKGGRLVLFPEGRLSRHRRTDEALRRHRLPDLQDPRQGHHRSPARRPTSPILPHPGWHRCSPRSAPTSATAQPRHPGDVSTSRPAPPHRLASGSPWSASSSTWKPNSARATCSTPSSKPAGAEPVSRSCATPPGNGSPTVDSWSARVARRTMAQLLHADARHVGVLLPNVNATPVTASQPLGRRPRPGPAQLLHRHAGDAQMLRTGRHPTGHHVAPFSKGEDRPSRSSRRASS
jgi:hypothetical protein